MVTVQFLKRKFSKLVEEESRCGSATLLRQSESGLKIQLAYSLDGFSCRGAPEVVEILIPVNPIELPTFSGVPIRTANFIGKANEKELGALSVTAKARFQLFQDLQNTIVYLDSGQQLRMSLETLVMDNDAAQAFEAIKTGNSSTPCVQCFEFRENFDKPSSGSQPRSSFYNYLLYLCAVHFRYKVAARQSKALLDRLIRKAGGCRGVPILFYNLKGKEKQMLRLLKQCFDVSSRHKAVKQVVKDPGDRFF